MLSSIIEVIKKIFEVLDKLLAKLRIKASWEDIFESLTTPADQL